MNSIRDLKRLQHFYGAVASEQNQFILASLTGKEILELGCGYGTFAQEAHRAGKKIIGLDIDFRTLEIGKNTYPDLNAKLVAGDMGSLPFKNNSAVKEFHKVSSF